MQKFDISFKSIIKFFLVLLGIVFLYFIRDVLVLLFIVVILVTALEPFVNYGEKLKIPRSISTIFLYILIFGLVGLTIYIIIPPLVYQIKNMAINLPHYASNLYPYYHQVSSYISNWQQLLNSVSQSLGQLTGGIYSVSLAIFGGLASIVTMLVITFYLLVEKDSINKFALRTFALAKKEDVLGWVEKISQKLGSWLRGQIIVSLTMGVVTALGMYAIGLPYALTIGVLAAVLEIIPVIGPIITGTVAVIIALLAGSWVKALIIVGFYIVAQMLENHFLVPKVMGKAVGVSPAVILIALLIGAKLGGVLGAIIAIPMAAAIFVIIDTYLQARKIRT